MSFFKQVLSRWRRRWAKAGYRRPPLKDGLNRSVSTAGRFCPNPFRQLDVYEGGQAYLCCSSWLPTSIGNLSEQTVAQAWNSERAQAIRAGILDGSFRHCDHQVCPVIQDGRLPTLASARQHPDWASIIEQGQTRLEKLPEFINLCNDASCNLWCPSCRQERINHVDGEGLAKARELQDRIVQDLLSRPTDRHFRINVTGSGDPFASRVYRDFLFGLDGEDFPNLRISLQTNGVLLTPKNWRRMARIHPNIDQIVISFDAASPDTYAVTRRGGHWPTLLENVAALGALRQRGELAYLRLDFVVQQANYREIPAFVELAEQLGADHACFSLLLDWGTWPTPIFDIQAVWKRDHPEFPAFLEVLRDPSLTRSSVILGNLQPYVDQARSNTALAAS